jgi:hypothetical protein
MWELPPSWTGILDRLRHHFPKPIARPNQPVAGPTMPPDQLNLTLRQPQTGQSGGRISLDTAKGQYIKDPAFVNNGQEIGGKRYVVFGNLNSFYMKEFSVDGQKLDFKGGEIPISINGLAPNLNSPWAPQIVVNNNQVQLFYTAGTIDGKGINWPSYRLHMASIPLDEFVRQAQSGKGVSFHDKGTLFDDQVTFGGANRNFAMIDPQYYVNPQGEAYLTYTVVTPASFGHPHQEFVRSRRVDPNDPTKPLGPDTPLVDGWAFGPHDGVAEAQDVVNINGQPYLFISSHGGDKDQRVLVAPVSPKLDTLMQPQQFRTLLSPGSEPWRSDAVGSTGAAVIDGKPFMIYQGMDANHQFSLGWTSLEMKG